MDICHGVLSKTYTFLNSFLDKIISDAPDFVGEEEWLKDKEQEVMMEILKK